MPDKLEGVAESDRNSERCSLGRAFLPSELTELILYFVFEMVKGRGARPAAAILLLKVWQPVDLAICLLHSSVEGGRPNQTCDGPGLEESKPGAHGRVSSAFTV